MTSQIDSTRKTTSNAELSGSGSGFPAVLGQVTAIASGNCTVQIEGQAGIGTEQPYRENLALRDKVDRASMFQEIVGSSLGLQTVRSHISEVAPTDSTVLITSETGPSKSLSLALFQCRSNRASRAFVTMNCAAIPRDLIASKLSGHEKGAFTGAMQRRIRSLEAETQ